MRHRRPQTGLPCSPTAKRCSRCRAAFWRCRGCDARCCEHLCSLKTNDGFACCGACRRVAGTVKVVNPSELRPAAEPLFRVTRWHGGRVVREYGLHPRELAERIAQLAIERHPDADYVMCEPVKETT